jgi:hypothetical protein
MTKLHFYCVLKVIISIVFIALTGTVQSPVAPSTTSQSHNAHSSTTEQLSDYTPSMYSLPTMSHDSQGTVRRIYLYYVNE